MLNNAARKATLFLAFMEERKNHGAGNETRTRDPDLGKVVLYQLSYSRARPAIIRIAQILSTYSVSSAIGTHGGPRRTQILEAGPNREDRRN